MIIPVHNEEAMIREKIENVLSLRYPDGKLEIVVVSDSSTDGTDSIVSEYTDLGIRVVRLPERGGKTAAQNLGLTVASGEIVIFSDAATMLNVDAIEIIVRSFHDPSIGCVTSEDRHVDRHAEGGESLYVRYDGMIRNLESRVGSLVGASGSFFAARRELAIELEPDLIRDFFTPLYTWKMGFRAVVDQEAVGFMKNVASVRSEFQRKVRTVHTGLVTFFYLAELLNPIKYGFFAFQLISHKLCRWVVPILLLVVVGTSVLLVRQHVFYQVAAGASLVFFILAAYGFYLRSTGRKTLPKIAAACLYFFFTNLSILVAWTYYLRGSRIRTWEPSKR
jgi:cellulose synthase/poly-beta-1,6-N-acetylglucosamine synthase-like glycosyltransferase